MIRSLAALSLLLLLAPNASAYSISMTEGNLGAQIVRWHTSNIPYYLHPNGSADVVDGSDLNDVRAGWQQWNGVSCSALNFTEAGMSSSLNVMSVGGPPNDKNDVVWVEGSQWSYGAYVLGITNTSFNPNTGEILEADIAFNGYLNKWSTSGAPNTVDVLNVAGHEQGHFFGAQHVLGGYDGSDPPTMAPNADPYLKSQSIEPDDELCACFLYPKTEYFCQTDADCPFVVETNQWGEESYVLKITCESNGLCAGQSAQIPEGTKVLGEACASDFDCVKPFFCQPSGSGGTCAKNCNTDTDCGDGFSCFPYTNSPGGVCLPWSGGGGGPVATKEAGEQCSSPQECKSGLCVGSFGTSNYYCRLPCSLGGNDCGSGETCTQLQGSSTGACLPGGGSSGTKPPGALCQSPAECLTGLCVGTGMGTYKCRESCTPSIGDCPELHECFQLAGGAGGACIPVDPKSELGEPCEFQNDCVSDMCLSIVGSSDGPYCSQGCAGDSGCPCGMLCTQFQGNESFCTFGGPTACTPSGNPCDAASECISGSCISGVCRDPCKVTVGGCPPGQTCQRFKEGSINGVCLGGGPLGPGVGCSQDAECQTGLCELSVCAQPCDPATSVCGEGLACLTPEGASVTVCAPALDPPPTGGGTTGGGTTGGGTTGGGTTGGGTTGGGETGGTTGGTGTGGGETGGSTTGGASGGGSPPVDGGSGGGTCAAAPAAPGSSSGALWLAALLLSALVIRRRIST